MAGTDNELAQAVMAEANAMFDGHNPVRCQKVVDAMSEAGGGELTTGDLFMIAAMMHAKALSLTLSPQHQAQTMAMLYHANLKLVELRAQREELAAELAGVAPAGHA